MRAPLLSLLCLTLAGGDFRMEAPLTRARLYPDQAWLTREARLTLTQAGSHRVRLEGLPQGLSLEDLRVQVEGIAGLRLGNVSVIQVVGTFEPDATVKGWQAELADLSRRALDLGLRQAAMETALKALEALKPQGHQEQQPHVSVDPKGAAEFSRAAQARHLALLQQGLALALETKPLLARQAELTRLLAQREQAALKRSSTVVVELQAPGAGEARITCETRAAQARWKPTYEARLAEDGKHLELLCYAAVSQASGEDWKGVGLEISNAQPGRSLTLPVPPSALQLLYEAPGMVSPGTLEGRVTDRGGRPQTGLKLTLTNTALKVTRTLVTDANGVFRFSLLPTGDYVVRGTKPGQPELVAVARVEAGQTQSLGLVLGESRPVLRGGSAGATVEVVSTVASVDKSDVRSATLSSQSLESLPYSRSMHGMVFLTPGVNIEEEAPLTAALEPATTHTQDAGELGRAWILEGARTLPSDAAPRRMLLARVLLDATPRLRALPRLSSDVFSLTLVNPTAGFPWFTSTPVTVFQGGERLGQIPLPPQVAGEPVAIGFGPKAGVRVQRTRLEARMVAAKGAKGRQWSLRERVTVLNELPDAVEVEVLEPTPRSVSDRVKVEPLPGSTALTRTTATGLSAWRVAVPAKGQAKVEEGWKITGPGTGHIPELPDLGLPHSD